MGKLSVLMSVALLAFHLAHADAPVFEDEFEAGTDKWEMTDPNAWELSDDAGEKVLALKDSSSYMPPVRSPKSIARVKDLDIKDFIVDVNAKQTGKEYNHRDLCVFFNYNDPSHFYYVHLASIADEHANSIFLVNGAARVSIAAERTNGTAWTDRYHHIRVIRCSTSGSIEVYFDDLDKPVMKAVDTTLGGGTIGLGSFDDVGNFASIKITPLPADSCAADKSTEEKN